MNLSSPSPRSSRPPRWATVIATSFGAGFMPKAPGHTGTLTAVPLAWALGRLGQSAFLIGLAIVTVVGSVAADVFGRATGKTDDQRIVIDEVAGYLVTLVPVARSPVNLVLAFGLFRLFDVWKPPPIGAIDRNVPGGFGVMADDLGAGVYGAIILYLLNHCGAVARLSAWLGL